MEEKLIASGLNPQVVNQSIRTKHPVLYAHDQWIKREVYPRLARGERVRDFLPYFRIANAVELTVGNEITFYGPDHEYESRRYPERILLAIMSARSYNSEIEEQVNAVVFYTESLLKKTVREAQDENDKLIQSRIKEKKDVIN